MTAPLSFETVEPVTRTNPGAVGRDPMPNPFKSVIAEIALKTDPKNPKKPLTKSFVVDSGTPDSDLVVRRYSRQLTDAGLTHDPQVSVYKDLVEVDATHTRITFWTTKKVNKPRTPKSDAPTA